jgi:DNA-binding MarR family transcriptional regulator
MGLKDLIVEHKRVSEELLENILKGRAQLIKEGREVILKNEGNIFPERVRVLLYLCGKKAWEYLTAEELAVSIEELAKNLGIKGNTLRPILKGLNDAYYVERTVRGRYRILPKGIGELEKIIKQETLKEGRILETKVKKDGKSTRRNPISAYINKFYNEGYFKKPKKMTDLMSELRKQGLAVKLVHLPPYLLRLVRTGRLNREQIIEGKRKIWVYKLPGGKSHE